MRRREILFVDGYNMIGSWPELEALKKKDEIEAARSLLLFELSNYRKYRDIEIIVVFDAQLVPGATATFEKYQLTVVFTEEGETADSYIERTVKEHIDALTRVVVATSDATEQWIIFQQGALRKSANELLIDVNYAKSQIRRDISTHFNSRKRRRSPWTYDHLEQLDRLREQIEGQDN